MYETTYSPVVLVEFPPVVTLIVKLSTTRKSRAFRLFLKYIPLSNFSMLTNIFAIQWNVYIRESPTDKSNHADKNVQLKLDTPSRPNERQHHLNFAGKVAKRRSATTRAYNRFFYRRQPRETLAVMNRWYPRCLETQEEQQCRSHILRDK